MDAPIYEELSAKYGITIPDPFTSDPIAALAAGVSTRTVLPAIEATTRLPVVLQTIDPDEMPPERAHSHGLDEEGE